MKRSYAIVTLIMLTFFVISFLTNIIGALNPDFIQDFDLSLTLAALLPFAFLLLMAWFLFRREYYWKSTGKRKL